MELTELKDKIIASFKGQKKDLDEVLALIENDKSVFPFNEYELLICSCIEKSGLTYQKYLEIRNEYRLANPFLWIFEISSPTQFGSFAERHLITKSNDELQIPNKTLDANYNREYDLWLDGIKIEVKASRFVKSVSNENNEPLYKKALSSNTKSPFIMNFQQLKPNCCDVFVWMAVFRDKIVIWVMSSKEVQNHPDYSKGQHRGNEGEGQLHITEKNIDSLTKYELKDSHLSLAIQNAYKRNI